MSLPPKERRSNPPALRGFRVHAGSGDKQLDLCLELARRRTLDRPLLAELCELADLLADLAGCEICSIYMREGEDVVMRANHGFRGRGVGRVRMRVGEGLTGLAVECLRPVSGSLVTDHRSKRFPALREEDYPVFLAMPLVSGQTGLGALVLQRRERSFSAEELRLFALASGIVVRHLAKRTTLGGPVRLLGKGVGFSVGVGRLVEASFAHHPIRRAPSGSDLTRALTEHAERSGRVQARIQRQKPSPPAAEALVLTTMEAHFPAELFALLETGCTVENAIANLSAAAARGRTLSNDPFVLARARDIEALGRLLLATAAGERPFIAAGSVVVSERLAVAEAMLCVEAGVAGVALAAAPEHSSGLCVLEAVGVPAVAGLEGVFVRVREGARAIVDAAAGALILDPSRSDLTLARRRRHVTHQRIRLRE